MAALGRMHISIDVARYHRLPDDVRARFDVWLDAEKLKSRRVVKLTLGEAAVTIDRLAVDDNGKAIVQGNEFVTVTEVISVRTMPPREAFDA